MVEDGQFLFGKIKTKDAVGLMYGGDDGRSRQRDRPETIGEFVPVMIISLFFSRLTAVFEKTAVTSSSHNCPREIRVPVWSSSMTYADCAALLRKGERGSRPTDVVRMTLPFAARTVGPFEMGTLR